MRNCQCYQGNQKKASEIQKVLSASPPLDWDNPQFSYRFKLVYSLRTKIERLFSRMKVRFKMVHIYKRGISNIRGHILASLTGTYGV